MSEKFEPCCCGANRRKHTLKNKFITLTCEGCGLYISGTSEYGAKLNWNKIMRKIKYGEGDPWRKTQ